MLHDGPSKADALKRAGDLLELVEISRGRVANYPREFSGGMKQRVMIAMAWPAIPRWSSETSRPQRWTSWCRHRS